MAIYRLPVTMTSFDTNNLLSVNVLHVDADDGTSLQEAADAIQTFYSSITNVYESDTTITNFGTAYEQPVGGVGPWEPVPIDTWAVTGTGISQGGPEGLAFMLRWRGELPGRRGSGRTFIGPLGGVITGAEIPSANSLIGSADSVLSAARDLVDESTASAGWDLVVYSPTNGTGTPVVSVTYFAQWAFLRSRRT